MMVSGRELAGAARAEADRMLAAAERATDNTAFRMSAAQFRSLATLLGRVADVAQRPTTGFDEPIDGVRFWVPLSHLERERARFDAMLAARPFAMMGDTLPI